MKRNYLLGFVLAVALLLLVRQQLLGTGKPAGTVDSGLELQGIAGYINTHDNLTLAELRAQGKVILVDFWTYSCINCIRTLPYLVAWDKQYRDKGLVIVGVHTPEFAFEKEYKNVEQAVINHGIEYPVVLDNDYKTWNAFGNRYWPHKYLLVNGKVVYHHIGEGGYKETERQIQLALNATGNMTEVNAASVNFGMINTPEIYLGYRFTRGNFGQTFTPDAVVNYTLPDSLEGNTIYLEGTWKNNQDNMELISETGKIVLIYNARDAIIVAGSERGTRTTVMVDGSVTKTGYVQAYNAYKVGEAATYGTHNLQITLNGPGLRFYTFTFG